MKRRVWHFVLQEESDFILLKHFANNPIVSRYAYAKHNSGVYNYRPHYHFVFSLNDSCDCYEFTAMSGYLFEELDIPSCSFDYLLAYLKRTSTKQDVLVVDGIRM